MRQNIIAGIDIGTFNIHAAVASLYPSTGRLEILASVITPAQGMRKGTVIAPQELTESLRGAIDVLEKKAGLSLDEAYVSISGAQIEIKESKGVIAISRADGEVSEEDIQRVISAAETFSLPQNKEIIHTIPQDFAVDKETGIENPRGMKGVRLELNALVIKAFRPHIQNLLISLQKAGIRRNDVVFTPLASAQACLSRRQKELGVILIDFGGATTEIAVYEENILRHAAVIPIGSSHVTNDIAIAFKIPIDIAETLKIKFGSALEKLSPKNEKIDLKKMGISDEKIPRSELARIIEARIREVMEMVNQELAKINKEKMLPAGAVLVGGGSKLEHLVECAKDTLGLPAQIGYPRDLEGLIEEINSPEFAATAGLLKWSKVFAHNPRQSIKKQTPYHGYLKKTKDFFKNLIP